MCIHARVGGYIFYAGLLHTLVDAAGAISDPAPAIPVHLGSWRSENQDCDSERQTADRLQAVNGQQVSRAQLV
jgi:hypothetical protein